MQKYNNWLKRPKKIAIKTNFYQKRLSEREKNRTFAPLKLLTHTK